MKAQALIDYLETKKDADLSMKLFNRGSRTKYKVLNLAGIVDSDLAVIVLDITEDGPIDDDASIPDLAEEAKINE